MKAKPKDSYRELFKRLGVLTLYSQYIYSTLMFVVRHKDLFIHIYTHKKLDLHVPSTRLTRMQKWLHYSGIILFNALLLNIKEAAYDSKKFKHLLKAFLISTSFYSVEEYLIFK
jgi:hypothetical protein